MEWRQKDVFAMQYWILNRIGVTLYLIVDDEEVEMILEDVGVSARLLCLLVIRDIGYEMETL